MNMLPQIGQMVDCVNQSVRLFEICSPKMDEIHRPSIRSLDRIAVSFGDASFSLSLDLDQRQSEHKRMDVLEIEFMRQLREVTFDKYFSVEGHADSQNVPVELIFARLIVNPYLKDGPYPHISRDGTGLLPLAPVRAHVNNNPAPGRGSVRDSTTTNSRTKRHAKTFVRSF